MMNWSKDEMSGMEEDYEFMIKMKTRKVNDGSSSKIKLMKPKAWQYRRRNNLVSNGEDREKTSLRGEPGFFFKCHDEGERKPEKSKFRECKEE